MSVTRRAARKHPAAILAVRRFVDASIKTIPQKDEPRSDMKQGGKFRTEKLHKCLLYILLKWEDNVYRVQSVLTVNLKGKYLIMYKKIWYMEACTRTFLLISWRISTVYATNERNYIEEKIHYIQLVRLTSKFHHVSVWFHLHLR